MQYRYMLAFSCHPRPTLAYTHAHVVFAAAQADPVAATQRAIADAVQAWDKTRAALAALQQSAAELGLSPGAIQEQAAKLLQNMPRAIGTDGNAGNPNANGQPNAIPMTAQLGNLMTGLGLSATSIAEQLTRKSLDGSEQGGGGGGGLGLISGLLGGLTGNSPLPPGCVRLVAGAHMIPHVDKVDKGGEDAYFISRVGLGGVGVADGVSGWADEGIDPAEYPRCAGLRWAGRACGAACCDGVRGCESFGGQLAALRTCGVHEVVVSGLGTWDGAGVP